MSPPARILLIGVAVLALAVPNATLGGAGTPDCNDPDNTVSNCGFESGDFDDWIPLDNPVPFIPLRVDGAGVTPGSDFFISDPTEGEFAALTGWDGAVAGSVTLAQDVSVPDHAALEFDYRAGWNLRDHGATVDRTFQVHVEPSGGGFPDRIEFILVAEAGSFVSDTGNRVGIVDLGAFAREDVRIKFVWTIPEGAAGPAFFQLDNVSILQERSTGTPATSTVGTLVLVALFSVLLIVRSLPSGRPR